MAHHLFRRQPLASPATGAEEAPTSVTLEVDAAVPAESAEPVADLPVDAPSGAQTSLPCGADFSAAEAEIARIAAVASPYERLRQLRAANERWLIARWSDHVETIEAAAASLRQARDAERNAAVSRHEAGLNRIDNELEAVRKRCADSSARLRREHADFVAASDSFVSEVWSRIAPGLDLEPASPTAPAMMMAGPDSSGSYEATREQAQLLPAFGPFTEDPMFKRGLPWAGGIGFVVGALAFGATGGMIVAAWCAVGVLIAYHLRRSHARELFRQLVEETALEQARRRSSVDAEFQRQNEQATAATARLTEERKAIVSNSTADLAAVDALYAAPLATQRLLWEDGRARFVKLIDDVGDAVADAIAEQPARLGRWDQVQMPVAALHDLTDQMRNRLGETVLVRPQGLSRASADLLGCSGDAPRPLKARPPEFFDLAAKQSLILYDDKPAGVGIGAIIGSLLARMLIQLPPGTLNLTLFDPVGLGRNYSPFLKLSDFSDALISGKVWSEKEHIRRKLKELIEHIETVTQKYLRADFPDIESYNVKAGQIAEPYRILVVSDFPDGFDDDSVKDLVRIVQNGARCGVFAIMHINTAAPLPYGVDLAALEPFCARVEGGDGRTRDYVTGADNAETRRISVDLQPDVKLLDEIVTRFGEGAKAAKRVEVPYRDMLALAKIPEDSWWARTSEQGIEVPLGPLGARKVQAMRLGSGLAHHALLVGRPGSGKSNLIHVFISAAARLYSPSEIQLYLVDFKKGVEFKAYADALLPHARVIAVESEREFGLSVLQGLDAELKRRGELFRASGTSSFAEFRTKGNEHIPRVVLVVDEFQEFFSRDDRISREAAVLFDRLVRQGRAFGVHLILGTQSLANAGLQKPTQDQMAVRIALQCSEADSRLILAEDNVVARSLSRPGEAIYNDAAGLVEGNAQFQVAMFTEEDRARELSLIAKAASRKKWKGDPPVVFEGHEPAELAASRPLASARPRRQGDKLELWVGEPTALKPPVSALLRRQAGRNMIVLTRDEEEGVGVVLAGLCSLAAQTVPGELSLKIVDLSSADAAWAEHPEELAAALPHDAEVLGKRDVRSLIPELEALVTERVERSSMREPTIVLVVIGLQRARDLRADDVGALSMRLDVGAGENLGQAFEKILQDGPEVGVHTILWCDTLGNLDRVIDRRSLNEVGLRISGALSPPDSSRLFDDDVAAGIDKPHRLVKFDDEQVGVFELFRPYAVPSVEFIRAFGARLRARADSAAASGE